MVIVTIIVVRHVYSQQYDHSRFSVSQTWTLSHGLSLDLEYFHPRDYCSGCSCHGRDAHQMYSFYIKSRTLPC